MAARCTCKDMFSVGRCPADHRYHDARLGDGPSTPAADPAEGYDFSNQSKTGSKIKRPERTTSAARENCCADWPKPCSYHEGWQDALDTTSPAACPPHTSPLYGLRARLEEAERLLRDAASLLDAGMNVPWRLEKEIYDFLLLTSEGGSSGSKGVGE